MPVFDHFDLLAPLYEVFIRQKNPQELWRLADLPVSGALLDAGGGTRRVAQLLTRFTTSVTSMRHCASCGAR